jgi:hypothetical protein
MVPWDTTHAKSLLSSFKARQALCLAAGHARLAID